MCRGLAQELGINTWFRQGGYLFLARTAQDEAMLQRNAELHQQVGAPTRLLGPAEARDVVPQLDVSPRSGWRPTTPRTGSSSPGPSCGATPPRRSSGGRSFAPTPTSTTIEPQHPTGFTLRLSTGESIHAGRVINATGAWSVGINRSVGHRLSPTTPIATRSCRASRSSPFSTRLVAELATGLYFSQSTRGEIVAGVRMPAEEDPTSAPPSTCAAR